jgi:DNA invertase Pin-like site-specific DNA recombinase
MKIGYARVSTREQSLNLQLDALEKAACQIIYKEQVSSAANERKELQKLLDSLRQDDVVVVWKLDRLGRSLPDLIKLVTEIQSKGAELQSLNDKIDTTTTHGKLVFHLFASIAEFERDIIRDRTRAGLAAAKARGRLGGRPKGLSSESAEKAEVAASLYRQGWTVRKISEHLKISRTSFYKYLEVQKDIETNQ